MLLPVAVVRELERHPSYVDIKYSVYFGNINNPCDPDKKLSLSLDITTGYSNIIHWQAASEFFHDYLPSEHYVSYSSIKSLCEKLIELAYPEVKDNHLRFVDAQDLEFQYICKPRYLPKNLAFNSTKLTVESIFYIGNDLTLGVYTKPSQEDLYLTECYLRLQNLHEVLLDFDPSLTPFLTYRREFSFYPLSTPSY